MNDKIWLRYSVVFFTNSFSARRVVSKRPVEINRTMFFRFQVEIFFQITTQLQYIEDSELVVDGSRNRWCAVQ